MRVLILRSLAIALCILPFAPTLGAEPDEPAAGEIFIVTPALNKDEDPCPADEVVDTDFVEVSRNSTAFHGKCVRMRALLAGRALHGSIEGYYLAGPIIGSLADSVEQHRIGVYASSEIMDALDERGAHFATVTGVMGECANLRGGNVMSSGYCHYTDGPYIVVADVTAHSADIVRQTGERARASFGNLHPAPTDWLHRCAVEGMARRWLQAIQRQDSANFALLHHMDLDDVDARDDEPSELFYEVFTATDSAFASFRNSPADLKPELFLVARDPGLADEGVRHETIVACFCRNTSCAERWPISLADAANDPARPYICVQIDAEHTGENVADLRLRTEMDWHRLKEP